MFNNNFREMKGKKVIHWEGGLGEPSKLLLGSVFLYLLGYPTILLGYPSNNHTFMPSIGSGCVGSFYSCIFLLKPFSWKVTFSGTQKPTPPTVFNLQALDWVHCEEETGVYCQLSRVTYKLVKKNYKFLMFVIFPQKRDFQKKILKFILQFFFKKRYLGIRIYVLNAMITSNLLYL